MSRPSSSAAAGRCLGIGMLLAALFAPVLFVGIGETARAHGAAELVLTSPDAAREAPGETDTASAAFSLVFPAGLPSERAVVPAPTWTRFACGSIDLLPGLAVRPSFAPPPRRA